MLQRQSPTLDELLGDSLIQAVMRADRVEPGEIRTLFASLAERGGARARAQLGPANVGFARPPIDRRAPPRAATPSRASPLEARCGSALCG